MNRLLYELAIIVALLGLVVGSYWVTYQAGQKAGRSEVQAQWASDRAAAEKRYSEAVIASREEIERQVAAREEVERGLSEKLAAADARGRDLADRLRDALAPARACPVPPAGAPAGAADGATGKPGDQAGIGAALAAHLAACERDAERFVKLQDWARVVVH